MKTIKRWGSVLFIILIFACQGDVTAQRTEPIRLPEPELERGRPLMQVLKDRKTTRAFGSEALPVQELSNLLWAAFGINRPEDGHRTAPSAMNNQEIDIYVAMADGLYIYDALTHILNPVLSEDLRALTGTQEFVRDAPVTFVYVADYDRMGDAEEDAKVTMSNADTGFIGQNVYLYCASEGLVTGVRGSIDKPALSEAMKLGENQHIILAQSVGYPTE